MACSFHSPLSLDEMRTRLDAEGSCKWHGRGWHGGDNDHRGEYLSAYMSDNNTKLRVFMDEGRYVIDARGFNHPGTLPSEVTMNFIRKTLLPLLEATEVGDHSGWE